MIVCLSETKQKVEQFKLLQGHMIHQNFARLLPTAKRPGLARCWAPKLT